MGKSFCPFEPNQMLLLPPSIADWLPEGHQLFVLRDFLETIDLTPITSIHGGEKRGYHYRERPQLG